MRRDGDIVDENGGKGGEDSGAPRAVYKCSLGQCIRRCVNLERFNNENGRSYHRRKVDCMNTVVSVNGGMR